MIENREHIDTLIAEFLSSDIDEQKQKELLQWLRMSADNRRYFSHLRDLWLTAESRSKDGRYDADRAFDTFRSRVDGLQNTANIDGVKQHSTAIKILRYAAVLLAFFIVGYIAYRQGGSDVRSNYRDIEVEAPIGSISKVTLPDGSKVILNAGSHLSYSQGFGVDNRDVQFRGEGYFEVKHNEHTSFRIINGKLNLQVLGTKFNFRCYDDEPNIIVALVKGSVELDNSMKNGEKTVLKPNECAVFSKADGTMTVTKVKAEQIKGWTIDKLIFEEEYLINIAKALERSYNVKITIATDSLRRFKFYGIFNSREQSVDDVLQALASTNKIKYVRHGRHIEIY